MWAIEWNGGSFEVKGSLPKILTAWHPDPGLSSGGAVVGPGVELGGTVVGLLSAQVLGPEVNLALV